MADQEQNEVQTKQIAEAVKRFNGLHGSIFGDISSMLRTAKLAPIEDLRAHDPNFTEMVVILEEYKVIIVGLSTFLEQITEATIQRLDEYISLARDLAVAIESHCYDALGAAIAALDEKPYV
ncbi:hypothetical protein [Shewanella sp. MF08487]|uniref:hypothetical protein n=1 Tax=Shewanella sp. MF08487 TaxID=3434873 RepID=UPI003D7AE3A0